ncbi:HAMP domain-containing sensor histidine kinase [Aureimonas sp. AU20]|uniref:sensor histidine kinase n=1 Tax=Aureimonas sp. AU20 TaxID=1349819 RepID=UPI000721F712|nr:HAMP domain-containing sensor histidine kinase [Aureimonas sp. AU20]ALN71905.1 hypothetical protein M673_04195 [Aureimonas sp. AU20]
MSTRRDANASLWWRLSWHIGTLIFAVVMTVIVGLCLYATLVLSPNEGVEDRVAAAISEAMYYDGEGNPRVGDGKALRELKQNNGKFWYVVATTDRSLARYGAVPPVYRELVPLAHLFHAADIRGASGSDEIASVKTVSTDYGEIRVLFGGLSNKGWLLLSILQRSWPIYASLLALALPAIFIAVPMIVRQALEGVNAVASQASRIDPRHHGIRLSSSDIPAEIKPLVSAFNQALDRIEENAEKRQRFLIDAAHELRTPIAIMQTRIEGLADAQERRRLLSDVARLGETAEQLLDFERNDQAPDINEDVDLVEMTRMVVADLAPLAIAAGYEISFENDSASVTRQGSPTALPRAIANLVRNAIDHGGGSGMISVSVSSNGCIAVHDEGPGIPLEHRSHVFEPFYRAVPKSQGAGLGLSLVKQIVENHNGRIDLDGSGRGTSVLLYL